MDLALLLRPDQERLTPAQEAEARRFVQERIEAQLSTEPVDEPTAEALLKHAYQVAGLPPPQQIQWVDGPLQLLAVAPPSLGASVRERIQTNVEVSVERSARESVGARVDARVRTSVWTPVAARVATSVGNRVRESVEDSDEARVLNSRWASDEDSVYDGVCYNVWFSVIAYYEASRLACYRFFDTYLAPNQAHALAQFNELVSGYWLGQEQAVIVRRPRVLARDQGGRLHCATSKCLEYRDGWGFYTWHGVRVPERVILTPEQLTREDFLNQRDVEVRWVIQERMGARFVQELDGQVIDTGPRGTLYEVHLPADDPERVARYVQVQDASTPRSYFLRVCRPRCRRQRKQWHGPFPVPWRSIGLRRRREEGSDAGFAGGETGRVEHRSTARPMGRASATITVRMRHPPPMEVLTRRSAPHAGVHRVCVRQRGVERMERLPDLLDRLLDQFLRLEWPLATQLQPGLSAEAIEAQLQALPFHLPQEVSILYQWRNGDRSGYDLFPLAQFLPMEEAITFYQEQIQLSQENEGEEDPALWYWKPGWFPVFQWDYKVYHVVLGQERPTATAPVLYYDPEVGRTFRYPSLTQLLQIVVDCYETGAYFLEEAGDYRSLQEDRAKVAAIQRNSLPEQADAVLAILEGGLPGPAFETAIQDVALFLDPRAIEALLALVQRPSTSEPQRLRIISELGWRGDGRAMEPLLETVRTGASRVQREALAALSRLVQRLNLSIPTDPLLLALEDSDPQVRRNAARLLAGLDDPRAVPILQDWLQEQDIYYVWLVATLARFGDAQAIALLQQSRWAERAPGERAWFAQELGKWHDPRGVALLRSLLQDSVLSVRTAAAQALVQRNDLQVADALIQLVQTAPAAPADDAARLQQWALEALARWHDPRLEEVIEALLQHPTPQERRVMVQALQKSEGSWSVPFLLRALANAHPSVRADAATALGKRQVTEALEALVERVQDEDSHVRSRAAQALGRLRDARAVEPLIGALADPVREVQVRAIYALAELQDQRAREPVRQLTEATDEMVRRSARLALAQLESRTAGG